MPNARSVPIDQLDFDETLESQEKRGRRAVNKINRMLKLPGLTNDDRRYIEDCHVRAQSAYVGLLSVQSAWRKGVEVRANQFDLPISGGFVSGASAAKRSMRAHA